MNTESSLNFPHRHAISRSRFFLARAEKCSVDEREAFEAYLDAAIIFGRTALLRLKSKYGEGPGKLNQIIIAPPLRLELLMEDNNPDPTGFRAHSATEDDDLNSGIRAAGLYYFENEQPPATATVRRHLVRTTQLVADAEARFQT